MPPDEIRRWENTDPTVSRGASALAATTSDAHVQSKDDTWIDPDELDLGDQPPAAQQWAQQETGALPRYHLGATHAHPESDSFQVEVEVGGRRFPAAWGRSKREAEKRAAWEAVLVLRAEGRLAG